MHDDEELDSLLELMERRASRLSEPGRRRTTSDSFGRAPSVLSTAQPLKPGDSVGENYEVEQVMSHRAGATVALVRHRFVERRFTMKLLPTELTANEDHVARFKDEARATSMIGHDSIVFVTDFGHSNRHGFYYVMEYLDGETLQVRLQKAERLSIQAALDVALCAGGALAAVHELGIVHRDVCPGNLMSHRGDGSTEVWKLLDFGLSSKVVSSDDVLTLYDDPRYVAPEIAAGEPITTLADQFSLAAVLWHMLFGDAPWPRRKWTDATPDRWVEPHTPEELVREIGPYIRRVLLRALSAQADQRFADIDAFITAFQRASGRSRRATLPPIDVYDANRSLAGDRAATSVEIGTMLDPDSEVGVEESDGTLDPPSVEISLDMRSSIRPKITMAFQTAARLRREWRRNLTGGGVFAPTEHLVPPGERVVLTLRFSPHEATFDACVEEVAEDPAGLSIQFAAEELERVHDFIAQLDLGIVSPDTIVTPLRALSEDADLTSDEAFLLSRLPESTPIGRLRGMFASLPMDLDDVVARLVDKGWVAISASARQRIRSRSGHETPVNSETAVRESFVRETLQRADYFRQQGNFLAEIETLQLASDRYNVAEFHYRIALSKVQFTNDLAGARVAMQAAVNAEPDTPKYVMALRELDRLAPK